MKYSIWGYVFAAEKLDSGQWMVMGHAQGKRPFPLHKVGTSATEEEAVRRLKSWAGHVLATPVMVKVAVGSSSGQSEQAELFPCRVAR